MFAASLRAGGHCLSHPVNELAGGGARKVSVCQICKLVAPKISQNGKKCIAPSTHSAKDAKHLQKLWDVADADEIWSLEGGGLVSWAKGKASAAGAYLTSVGTSTKQMIQSLNSKLGMVTSVGMIREVMYFAAAAWQDFKGNASVAFGGNEELAKMKTSTLKEMQTMLAALGKASITTPPGGDQDPGTEHEGSAVAVATMKEFEKEIKQWAKSATEGKKKTRSRIGKRTTTGVGSDKAKGSPALQKLRELDPKMLENYREAYARLKKAQAGRARAFGRMFAQMGAMTHIMAMFYAALSGAGIAAFTDTSRVLIEAIMASFRKTEFAEKVGGARILSAVLHVLRILAVVLLMFFMFPAGSWFAVIVAATTWCTIVAQEARRLFPRQIGKFSPFRLVFKMMTIFFDFVGNITERMLHAAAKTKSGKAVLKSLEHILLTLSCFKKHLMQFGAASKSSTTPTSA